MSSFGEWNRKTSPGEKQEPSARLRHAVISHLHDPPPGSIACRAKTSHESAEYSRTASFQTRNIFHHDRGWLQLPDERSHLKHQAVARVSALIFRREGAESLAGRATGQQRNFFAATQLDKLVSGHPKNVAFDQLRLRMVLPVGFCRPPVQFHGGANIEAGPC